MSCIERAYPSIDLSRTCAREGLAPLRERLIDEGILRPDRNARFAPSHWDRLFVAQLPPGTVVLRIDDISRTLAERAARS